MASPLIKAAAGDWFRDIVRALRGSVMDGEHMVREPFFAGAEKVEQNELRRHAECRDRSGGRSCGPWFGFLRPAIIATTTQTIRFFAS